MNSSINEVAALARKAAKGAGYSWSMADEVSFTAAWLCRNGNDATGALTEHLAYVHKHGADALKLNSLNTPWCGADHGLCSVSAGAALSDLANELDTTPSGNSPASSPDITGELTQLVTPVLLIPFVAACCHQIAKHRASLPNATSDTACAADIHCDLFKAQVVASSQASWLNEFQLTSSVNLGPVDTRYNIRISTLTEIKAAPAVVEHRVDITSSALELLNTYAARTYAPATDASRDGAGAGTSDND